MRFLNGNNVISIFGEGMCTVPAAVTVQSGGYGANIMGGVKGQMSTPGQTCASTSGPEY